MRGSCGEFQAFSLAKLGLVRLLFESDYFERKMKKVDILIVGAGPTGLGAASRLKQNKHEDWLLIDAFNEAGGLAMTDVTPEGFLFDMGGHVIFSHYDYFDQIIDAAVGTGPEHWAVHERVSYVW